MQARTKVLYEDWKDSFRQQYPGFRPLPAEPLPMAAQPDCPTLLGALYGLPHFLLMDMLKELNYHAWEEYMHRANILPSLYKEYGSEVTG